MSEIAFESVQRLAAKIRARELSSVEALEHFVARVERHNPALNAVVTLDVERARAAARRADEALARGEVVGALHGVPMTVKDAFELQGVRGTAGAKIWANHVSTSDAVAVQRLKTAGAIIFGKTNTPAFCADWQSFNELFGTTNNPWDLARTPGGSSGGSAAALASGMTPCELGSDIAGSIRAPSGFCGVFGHKPTYGIVPMRGHMPGPPGTLAAMDLCVAGPLARSAGDLALLLDVLAGPQPEQAVAYRLELPPPRAANVRDYRVAAWLDDPACKVSAGVAARLQDAVSALRAQGVRVDEVQPDVDLTNLDAIYHALLDPLMVVGVSQKHIDPLERLRVEGDPTKPDVKFARNALIQHREWCVWNEFRHRLQATCATFFRNYDVLLTPITFAPAFPHDHSLPQIARSLAVDGETRSYHTDMFKWIALATTALLPATAVPVGLTSEGLPVGMQVIGPYLEDRTPIDFARRTEDIVGGFRVPPGYE